MPSFNFKFRMIDVGESQRVPKKQTLACQGKVKLSGKRTASGLDSGKRDYTEGADCATVKLSGKKTEEWQLLRLLLLSIFLDNKLFFE